MAIASRFTLNHSKKKLKLLLGAARNRHGEVFPCKTTSSFAECLTSLEGERACLWYNTADGSTHVVVEGEQY